MNDLVEIVAEELYNIEQGLIWQKSLEFLEEKPRKSPKSLYDLVELRMNKSRNKARSLLLTLQQNGVRVILEKKLTENLSTYDIQLLVRE
jgi:hypothetical protein